MTAPIPTRPPLYTTSMAITDLCTSARKLAEIVERMSQDLFRRGQYGDFAEILTVLESDNADLDLRISDKVLRAAAHEVIETVDYLYEMQRNEAPRAARTRINDGYYA